MVRSSNPDEPFEPRVRDLEHRLDRLEEALAAVAADLRDLHLQLAGLVTAVERRLADPQGTSAAELTMLAPHEPLAPVRPLPVRVAKWTVATAASVFRGVLHAARAPEEREVRPRLVPGPAPSLPRLSIVTGPDPASADALRRDLAAQTDRGFELAVWDCTTGSGEIETVDGAARRPVEARSFAELRAALDGEAVVSTRGRFPGLAPTFVETIRWLLAGERLAVVRVLLDDGELLVVARELASALGAVDLAALARLARRCRVLGKVVRLGGGHPLHLPDPAPLGPGSGRVVRGRGSYLVAARTGAGPIEHAVVAPAAEPGPAPEADRRPTVLLLVGAPLVGGLEQRVAALVRGLADELRCVVAVVAAQPVPGGRRALALDRSGTPVYPLGDLFAEPLWPALVDRLVARYRVATVLGLGGARLRERFATLGVVDDPVGAAEAAALAAGPLPAAAPTPARVQALRAELGVPAGPTLVVAVCDLVPESRPEDFVALAARFRDDPGTWFLLVGEGPLEDAVADLGRLLGLTRFALCGPGLALADLVAAADVVCSTAEAGPAPPALLLALAVGSPVAAWAVDGVAAAIGDDVGAGGLVSPVGDLDALATAVRACASMPRPLAGHVARRQRLERAAEAALARYRQALRPAPGGR